MGSAAALAGEKRPSFAPVTAVAARAKVNFKPSRRVNMRVSSGSYWQARLDQCIGRVHGKRVPELMEPDEGAHPIDICVFRPYAAVQITDALAKLVAHLRRR